MRMTSRTAIPALFLSCLFSASAIAQTQAPTLEERMTGAEFRAAGLDKLSPDELARLNAWLEAHGSGKTQYVTPEGSKVFYPDSSSRETIEDRIAGTFSGWLGKTVFTLENGQKWQQAESGRFGSRELDHPKVKIKPMLMGSWLMYVEGCGCSVRVKRVE